MLIQLAVAIADGATTVSDIAVLRHQPDRVGRVASAPTVGRTLTALTGETLTCIAAARAGRNTATGIPAGAACGPRPTDKHGDGFYPLLATWDATGEPLAIQLRPGHAGSGTAVDPTQVLDAALAQLPVDPATETVIVRTDSAGCSHAVLAACDARGVRFLVGHPWTEELAATVIGRRRLRWVPAMTADGTAERDVGEVAEVTPSGDLRGWAGKP